MKILFVVDSKLTFSEAPPSRFLYIASSLQEKHFEVEILGRKGEIIKEVKTTQKSGNKHFARLRIIFSAYKKALSNSYKNIIIRGTLLAFPLLPLKVLGKRIILDFHGWLFKEIQWYYPKNIYNKLKVTLYYFLEKATTQQSNFIICTSKGTQNLLREREKVKSIILENGLDINEAKEAMHEAELKKMEIHEKYSIPRNKPLIGFLGNWERQLDMEIMFSGAKMAEVNMVVIGEGPNLNQFKKKWRNILFTGKLPRHKALEIIHSCNITLVPYKEVDTPLSHYSSRKVKDYLGLGKPIIMADVKGREKFLTPNKNVLLYKPGNAKDLADKIKRVISHNDLQEKMKQNNLMLARQFDWTTSVQESGLLEIIS